MTMSTQHTLRTGIQCQMDLVQSTKTIWRLSGDNASAADLLAAAKYVHPRGALFLIYGGIYIDPARVLKRAEHCDQSREKARSSNPDFTWDCGMAYREFGRALGDLLACLPCQDEEVFKLFDVSSLQANADCHNKLVSGFSASVNSYYSEDDGPADREERARCVEDFRAYLAKNQNS
jgi:hypothetical protein